MRAPAAFLFLIMLGSGAWANPCPFSAVLPPTGEVAGVLDESSCRLSSGAPSAQFKLHLPAPGKFSLQIETDGAVFPVLVRDSAGRNVAGNSLERGVYTVVVAAAEAGGAGKFTLKSTFQPEPGTLCRTVRSLGVADEARGSLSGVSCRNPGELPFESFQVTIIGSGVLRVSLEGEAFPGELLLRSGEGKLLASGRAEISAEVGGNQSLTVVVAGDSSEAAGNYKITTSFTPRDGDPCQNRAILDSARTVNDSISQSSCPFGGGVFGHTYTLSTAEPGVAEIRLTGLSQAGLLVLLDRNGGALALDYHADGTGKPFLRPFLMTGVYTLLVLAPRQGGDYALDYKFAPGLPPVCPVMALAESVAATGALSGAVSCRGQDTVLDSYRFALASPGTIELVMASNDFSSLLTLRDARDNVLVDSAASPGFQAAIVATLAAGDYSAVAASGRPGAYAIGYRFAARELPACPAATVDVNIAFIAVLGAGPCAAADGQPSDNYEFRVPSDGTVALFMTATTVDSHLTLLDADGNVLRRDDNTYGGTDALILQFLPAGTYRLVARSAAGGETGRYRVDILHAPGDRPAGCRPSRNLAPGETVQGLLTLTSCQWADDTFADVFKMEVAAARRVEVTLQSTRFDSYLELLDSKGNVVATDDDTAGNGNARIAVDLEPGVYSVVAKSFAGDGYAAGEYTIAVR